MKTSPRLNVLRVLAAGLIALVAGTSAFAQANAAPRYRMLTIGYMKPAQGKTAEYVRLEREHWKLIHQEAVNKGILTSWKFYAVSWPNGEDQEYDYVTVMEYPSFAALESPYNGIDFAKVLGGESKVTELRSATSVARDLRRTDTLTLLLATDGWSQAKNQVLIVHYLRSLPGKAGELMRIQREYFLPSNEELVKVGGAASWATSAVRYPSQSDFPYTHVSFNGYESLTQMEKDAPEAWRNKWTGEKSRETNAQLATSRKRVKGQFWRLIDQTTVAPAARRTTE